ncbi:transcriptional adapter ADA2b-like isoform X1 [Actinidia eriantha]|uniref:transcriptional adapter ADA2b-like isoform X1 n=1 Tax=Actinidia eriantha TaxID=165200 RepID=UPI0025903D24|nr:transcriptional adapter ADA2b-like isoform X1 [Actinidia eriantha]XP_057470842.1 transcriptional adapter ADA2b-like isoform X1 [Actinidia eriantha]XP_057470843.1 transcriptional adapter ADA2b-like isoform X1 [Actinidia eriantha]XP_057470902.1 transcriptional adapter ADA2b-like isoform X1 [Actinidia eriantha]XP_057470903.1 transcriptional adapter ADA2b-like isoform X1 [Actinidia eriantha]
MGRSRGNFHADEDPSQRSRRKKNASSGENLESTAAGQGTGEGKKALYHCNYCNKDLTGKIRIKCAMCPDFDLCIECFSVGAEVTPHKSNHHYSVMDNLSFPLICPDWNADEEILLLEGIEMYGMGNWTEIAEHVGTKSKEQCIQHYNTTYMNSPYFPLPDMTHVVGKNRKELLAMAKGHGEDKKGLSSVGELTMKEESLFSSSRIKVEDSHKNGSSGRLLSVNAGSTALKKESDTPLVKNSPNSIKVEDPLSDRSFGGKKPKSSKDEGPTLMELSGYNPKRHEFDPEYDNDAEQLLAEMEFKEADTEEERELKLRVLRIYSKRLDERKRRKDFILERDLLHPNPFKEDLSPEEKELCCRYDVFMRFHSKEEHDDLLKTVVQEHRIMKRIQELKEARAAGCRSSDEANIYLEQKRKRDAEENARNVKENIQAGASGQGSVNLPTSFDSVYRDPNSRTLANSSSHTDLDTGAFPGADLLSESEKQLCREIRLPPPDYLKIQEIITIQIMRGCITQKSDAYSFFNKIEPGKVDRVFDMVVKKGFAE